MIRVILRSLSMLFVGFGFLLLAEHLGILSINRVLTEVRGQLDILLEMIGIILVILMFGGIRYVLVSRKAGIYANTKDILAANFVGTAIGQWFPGALAIVEAFRISALRGACMSNERYKTSQVSLARITFASMVDRLIGFFGFHFIGFIGALGMLLIENNRNNSEPKALIAEAVVLLYCLFASLMIICFPFFFRFGWVGRLLRRIRDVLSESPMKHHHRIGFLFRLLLHVVEKVERAGEFLRHRDMRVLGFGKEAFLSVGIAFGNALLLFLSVRLFDVDFSIWAAMAGFPIIALSSLLPIGFGGIGGYQLIAAGIYGLLGAQPSHVAAAYFIQNVLLLVVGSLVGMLFFIVGFRHLRALFRIRKNGVDSLSMG